MMTRKTPAFSLLSALVAGLTLAAAGCSPSEPLVQAWQPETHPAVLPTAYQTPPTIKDEPETEAMQRVTEETRRKYFKAEIERSAREAEYFQARRDAIAREEAAPPVIVYSYSEAPQNTLEPVYLPVRNLPANCTYEERRHQRFGLFNTVVFGTLGGIIGHQSGHRDEGIAIGAAYGLLHDIAHSTR